MSGEAVDALWFLGGMMAACIVFLIVAVPMEMGKRKAAKDAEETKAKEEAVEEFRKNFGKKGGGKDD